MECWNIGILEYWVAKEYGRFLNFIGKMNFATKTFPLYPKTHYSIIPSFQHSLRSACPADWRPVGTKLLIRVFQSLMIP